MYSTDDKPEYTSAQVRKKSFNQYFCKTFLFAHFIFRLHLLWPIIYHSYCFTYIIFINSAGMGDLLFSFE